MKSPLSVLQRFEPGWRVAGAAAVAGLLMALAAAAAWASGGGEGGHGGGMSSTDWFRVMNFAVLAVALFLILRKPIPRALNGRIEGIQNQLKELEARKAEAEKRLAECNQKLSALETEAERIVADYIRQGQEAKARILKEAEAASEKIQAQARRNIEHEFEQSKARLQREIFEESLEKAEAMLKQHITSQDQANLVEDYLHKVVAS
jgi:F-type H+-transporting ATPase subunit b